MAAEVLNALDKSLSKSILVSIDERNPELGQAIRQKMFTFEDLARVDSVALQRIMREVDSRDLTIALKPASEKLQDALLAGVSKRAAESLREEIQLMGPIKLRDIEASQFAIIEVARRLEAEGEIDLGKVQQNSPFQVAA